MHHAVTLFSDIAAQPWRYGFFSVLREIERAYPDAPRWGHAQRLAEDPVRLAQHVSMGFEPAMVAGFCTGQGKVPRLYVNFFGLCGANGPMPLHFSEDVLSRQINHNDSTLAHFLDLFHHRLLTLLYRSWAMARPVVSSDRPADDRFAAYVDAFSPGALPALPTAPRYYASHLVDQRRSAVGLIALLRDRLRVPVALQTLVGRRTPLARGERLSLGARRDTSRLGCASLLGLHAWTIQHSFSVRLGPLPWVDYVRLLPGGEQFQPLRQLVDHYVGEVFEWDLELLLEPAQRPGLSLGAKLPLGQATWLADASLHGMSKPLRLAPARYLSFLETTA